MIVEVTPGVVAVVVSATSAAFAGGFFLGDLRWYKRSEGVTLEKALVGLTEAVKVASESKAGLSRVHERIDEMAATLNRLLGFLEKKGP